MTILTIKKRKTKFKKKIIKIIKEVKIIIK